MNSNLFKRTIQNIKRSSWRAYAVVFMMTVTFVILGLLLTLIYGTRHIALYIEQQPAVIGFFKEGVTEEEILEVKRDLETKDYVTEVSYVSKKEAMESFLQRYADNPEILANIQVNVFPAHLNVKATTLDYTPEISNYFRTNDLIDQVQALEETSLNKLHQIVFSLQVFGISLLIVFSISTVLIVFLTIGITVYSHKEELIIMKLVGASNSYIRSPYIVQGIVYSLLATLAAIAIIAPLVFIYFDPIMQVLIHPYYLTGLGLSEISIGAGIIVFFAILLAAFSSYFATRRYINS